MEDVSHAIATTEPGETPEIEAVKEIIDHYNRDGLGSHAKYFIYQGVKVYETGTMAAAKQDEDLPVDEIERRQRLAAPKI